MKPSFYLLYLLLLAPPLHAAEPMIVETDTEIIVEINGSDEDKLAAQKQVEERIKASAKELETEQYKAAAGKRRAEAKKDSEQE